MSKINFNEPIEMVDGSEANTISVDSQGRQWIEFWPDGRHDAFPTQCPVDEFGNRSGTKIPLIRNVAPPAEAVKLSDGSEIRGEWWICPKMFAIHLNRIMSIEMYDECGTEFRINLSGGGGKVLIQADARLIAAAIGLDIDAMIGGGK